MLAVQGKVFSRHELEQIADFAKRHNLVVLSDEVYEGMVFDGIEHVRIGSLPEYVKIKRNCQSRAHIAWSGDE